MTLVQLPTIASGSVLANATAGSTTPTATTATSWFDRAYCSTVGYLIVRTTGAWTCSNAIPLSVTWMGALCDNSTDDTTAIQNAFNLAATGGLNVYFPSGVCIVSSALNITGSGQIYGKARDGSIIKTNNATANILNVNASYVTIHDLQLAASVTKTAGVHINVVTSIQTAIRDVYLGNWFVGINLSGTAGTGFRVNNALINLPASTSSKGITIGGATTGQGWVDVLIKDTWIAGTSAGSQIAAGIEITNVGDMVMDHVSTIWAGNAVNIVPAASQIVQALFITNSFFDSGNGWGIFAGPTAVGGTVQLLKISNTWSASNSLGGIGLSGSGPVQHTDIVNVTASGNLVYGVLINTSTDTNTRIIGGSFSANTTGGIVANTNATKFTIMGARVGPSGQFGANGTGIGLQGGNDAFIISGNDVSGNTGAGINLASYSGTTGKIIDNIGYNPVGTATFTPPASTVAYKAGPSPETVYLGGGTVTNTNVNGSAIFYNATGTSNVIQLGPNETYTQTYSVVPSVAVRTIH